MYISTSYQIHSDDSSLSSTYTTNHDMRRVDGYLIFFATREGTQVVGWNLTHLPILIIPYLCSTDQKWHNTPTYKHVVKRSQRLWMKRGKTLCTWLWKYLASTFRLDNLEGTLHAILLSLSHLTLKTEKYLSRNETNKTNSFEIGFRMMFGTLKANLPRKRVM